MSDRLFRSRTDRVIGGLAGGLARNLGIDVTWVRLGWVVLAFITQGIAILLYLALLFVIPEEPEGAAGAELAADAASRAAFGAEGPPPDTAGVAGSAAAAGAGTAPAAAGTAPTSAWVVDRPAAPRASRSAPGAPFEQWLGRGDGSRNAALVVGVVLVVAGAWLLLERYVFIDFEIGWPFIAIVLGAILVVAAMRQGGRSR